MSFLRTLSGLAFWRPRARDCGCPDAPGSSVANGTYVRPGELAEPGPLEERENCTQPSPLKVMA